MCKVLSAALQDEIQLKFQVEQEKKEAERLISAKARFVATLSHELRMWLLYHLSPHDTFQSNPVLFLGTPLNGILCTSEELIHDNTLTPQQREYATIIESCSHQLMHVLNNVLDYAKVGGEGNWCDEDVSHIFSSLLD